MKLTHPLSMMRCACAVCALAACASDAQGEGTLSVSVQAEESITSGLSAGEGVEDIADGWSVRFDEYIAVLGDVDLHLASDHDVTAHAHTLYAVDLASVPESGLALWEMDALRAGRWEVHYRLGMASTETERHDSVTPTDFEAMVDDGLTYRIRGHVQSAVGRSCPPVALAEPIAAATASGTNAAGDDCYVNTEIGFVIDVAAETDFGPCEIDGVSGVSIPSGGAQSLALTLHGDHLFFNGFPTGSEGGVMRLAQWLADCDLNLDGEVTNAELAAIDLTALSEIDERFQLTGDLAAGTVHDYIAAQLKTQGHINGEGECAVDGADHDHE